MVDKRANAGILLMNKVPRGGARQSGLSQGFWFKRRTPGPQSRCVVPKAAICIPQLLQPQLSGVSIARRNDYQRGMVVDCSPPGAVRFHDTTYLLSLSVSDVFGFVATIIEGED